MTDFNFDDIDEKAIVNSSRILPVRTLPVKYNLRLL